MDIVIHDDLDLKAIAESGQCFRWTPLEDGAFQVIAFGKVRRFSFDEKKKILTVDCGKKEWDDLWYSYLDLDEDYGAVRKAILPEDPFLQEAAEEGEGIRILRQDIWEMVVTFIISQRKSIPAIRTAVEALSAKAGRPLRGKDGAAGYAFPSISSLRRLTMDELLACGLGYRARYIYNLCRLVTMKELEAWRDLPDEELLEALMALPGVGYKVAYCIMLFGYHRTDAFPRDVWILRMLHEWYPEGYPAERYAPWNGLMQQYLFAWYRKTHRSSALFERARPSSNYRMKS